MPPRSYYSPQGGYGSLCGLSEAWLCPRLRCGFLCGGLPDKRYKHYPYWLVYSCLSDSEPILAPGQQLSFLDRPKLLWKYGNTYLDHREWWLAAIHCMRGVLWWAEREQKEFGHPTVRVVRVNSKKKAGLLDIARLDPLKLDCKS